MNRLIRAMQSRPDTTTANGLPAFSSTQSAIVDLYYQLVRNIEADRLIELLEAAWTEDALSTLKCIFQARDCRGGKGDRRSFQLAFQWLIEHHLETAKRNLAQISEYGYWKDVVHLFDSSLSNEAVSLYIDALRRGDRLAFKWAPRLNKSQHTQAKQLQQALGLSEKAYKQYLKQNTQVVESLMCEHGRMATQRYDSATGQLVADVPTVVLTGWSKINYPTVPSIAMHRYRRAFPRHDAERFAEFMAQVKAGKVKIKAHQLYPHELVKSYLNNGSQDAVIDQQWNELLNLVQTVGTLTAAIPVVDVSGSMFDEVSPGVSAIEVSQALGLLLSQTLADPWTNIMIPFSREAKLIEVKGETLYDRVRSLRQDFSPHEGYDTNFIGVFEEILAVAQFHELNQSELPEMVVVLTDGQFNSADEIESTTQRQSISQRIRSMYQAAGYTAPVLVYWNLSASYNNAPATVHESDVMMISGFSPSAIKTLVETGTFDPASVVSQILASPRYDRLSL